MLGNLLSSAAFTAVIALGVAMYLLPAAIGWFRNVPDIGSVTVINILLGWTFLGWVVALAMALRTVNKGTPVVQVVQNPPPAPPQPPAPPPAGWSGPPGPLPPRPAPPPLDLPPGTPRPPDPEQG